VNISECTLLNAQCLLASHKFSRQAHADEPEASVLPRPHIPRTAGLHWFPTESIKQHNAKKDGFDLKLLIALLAAIALAALIWLAWHFYWTKRTTTATPSYPTAEVEMMPAALHDIDPLLDQDDVASEPEGHTSATAFLASKLRRWSAHCRVSMTAFTSPASRGGWQLIPSAQFACGNVPAKTRRAECWWLCDSIICWCSNCFFTGYVGSSGKCHLLLFFGSPEIYM